MNDNIKQYITSKISIQNLFNSVPFLIVIIIMLKIDKNIVRQNNIFNMPNAKILTSV